MRRVQHQMFVQKHFSAKQDEPHSSRTASYSLINLSSMRLYHLITWLHKCKMLHLIESGQIINDFCYISLTLVY